MKTIAIIIGSSIIATAVTFLSSAIIRTKTADVCFVYDESGFPLSFIETLEDQPDNDQCLPYALSKAHPTYNVQNLLIDWAAYCVVLTAAGLLISKKEALTRYHKTHRHRAAL